MASNEKVVNHDNGDQLFDQVEININPTVADDEQTRFCAEVSVSEQPIMWLANAIATAIEASAYGNVNLPKLGLSVVDEAMAEGDPVTAIANMVVLTTKVAIAARVAQCNPDMRTKFDKKNFEYLAVCGSLLGAYGVYHNEEEAYDIVPIINAELKAELEAVGAIDSTGAVVIPEWYRDAMLQFRRYKLMTGYGLPKEMTVNTPDIFKLTQVGTRIKGRPGISDKDVLIATLVYSSKLSDLFGAYRTHYAGISALRTTIESIGLKALHDLS
jgi:hypothetical protein